MATKEKKPWHARTTVREWFMILLITGLVMGLYFQNSFEARDDNVKNCEARNDQMQEVNYRTPKFNALFRAERLEPEHAELRDLLTPVGDVTLSDCEEDFQRPWPFR